MNFRILTAAVFATLGSSASQAQLVVDTTHTVEWLVQNLLAGPGVQVSNITWDGDSSQFGMFDATQCNLGLEGGLLMSTGRAKEAIGPNSNDGFLVGSTFSEIDIDNDLQNLTAGQTLNDLAWIEFDLVPTGDSLRMALIFASEEYDEFTGLNIDPFGIFLSGPGISGPFSNAAEIISLVPGEPDPVPLSIASVNALVNPWLYVFNGDGEMEPYYSDPLFIQYDAFTTVLEFAHAVESGATYHLKIAIADGSDWNWSSGVFIAGGSLTTDDLALGATGVSPRQNTLLISPNPATASTMITGFAKAGGHAFTLVDGQGRVVAQWSAQSDRVPLPVGGLAPGCYALRVMGEKGDVQQARVVIAH